MKVGQTLDKNSSGEAQAPYEEPYERSAFGDKIYHEPKIRERKLVKTGTTRQFGRDVKYLACFMPRLIACKHWK
jgi:hypothetical protein